MTEDREIHIFTWTGNWTTFDQNLYDEAVSHAVATELLPKDASLFSEYSAANLTEPFGMFIHLFDPLTTFSNEKTFLQDYPELLENPVKKYLLYFSCL